MLFNSFEFLIFYIVQFFCFYLFPYRLRWVFLLVSSYFFYMYWNPYYIFLIIISTLIDYNVGLKMEASEDPKRRKRLLLLSLMSNLGILFFFKYFNFVLENISAVSDLVGFGALDYKVDLLLPVGISFYTFQTLSYTIDIYRKNMKAEKSLGQFALYVSFFPQLVAGPIERAKELIPQINRSNNEFNFENFKSGTLQIFWGLFKKVAIADTLALYVNTIYDKPEINSSSTLLIATYFFAFQIYCDFSGYSDIAIGVAKTMNYRFMDNFRIPYFSKSITEFWRRWHISLSSWLRDYLYISLGGNRKGELATYKNLMWTMLLGGLWHGASWNFVIWGALNGIYLALEKFFFDKPLFRPKSIFKRLVLSLWVFHLICLTWIFFRAETFAKALEVVTGIGSLRNFSRLNFTDINIFATALVLLVILLITEFLWLRKLSYQSLAKKCSTPVWCIVCTVLILLISLFGVSGGDQFIYFQF